MSEIIVCKDDKDYIRFPTRLEDAHNYNSLAESLERKYDKRLKENEKVLNRIKSYPRITRKVLEDSAKKLGKWVY
ncbi:hypothetical protein SUSAZ_08940 [Sulfolobus acidocaldarius SUSAZ]|nr:hypothetical protein SUSAZ_08940 [Sulfolobus acidocaldarius SUSAZ]